MRIFIFVFFSLLLIDIVIADEIIGVWRKSGVKENVIEVQYAFDYDGRFAYDAFENNHEHEIRQIRRQGKYYLEDDILTIVMNQRKKKYQVRWSDSGDLLLTNRNKNMKFERVNISYGRNKNPKMIYDLSLEDFVKVDFVHACCSVKTGFCCNKQHCCHKDNCESLKCPIIKKQIAKQLKELS